ncbi:TPA: hypothetical protein I7122_18370 [Vibrio vulnificus]|nr:hypothetical protein [Vibrio vulnificus]
MSDIRKDMLSDDWENIPKRIKHYADMVEEHIKNVKHPTSQVIDRHYVNQAMKMMAEQGYTVTESYPNAYVSWFNRLGEGRNANKMPRGKAFQRAVNEWRNNGKRKICCDWTPEEVTIHSSITADELKSILEN